MKRVDERDNMFSRMNYKEGTEAYEDYYKRHPEKKEVDDALRAMPQIGQPGTALFHEKNAPMINSAFAFLADIKKYSEGEVRAPKIAVEPEEMTLKIKELAKFYGAKLVGICSMEPYHYYSHRGRETAVYGEEVTQFHPYGIVIAVELEKEMIYRAPQIPQTLATVKGYVHSGVIGMMLSYYIRELGYEARNHMDGNYLVVAPLVAQDAGLGEIGRHGLLLSKEFGARVRLAVITTDMPLIPDKKQDYGITKVCEVCERCATTCPGKAIPKGEKTLVEGIKRWKIHSEECYRRWRSLGTDCGICLANCPFSEEIPQAWLEDLPKDSTVIEKILNNFKEKHGIRPILRENPNWLK